MPANQPLDTNYEADLRQREKRGQVSAARAQRMQDHRDGVEQACLLNGRATKLENDVRRYDDPSSGFFQEIRLARLSMAILVMTIVIVLLIAIADFFLATPDVIEFLANKAYTVFGNFEESTSAVAAPMRLRITVGIVIVCVFLLITLSCKSICKERSLREQLVLLSPGDDVGYRNLRSQLWMKRGTKVAYLLVLAGLFAHLYTYDVQRARSMAVLDSLNQESTDWAEVGVRIFGDELETDEAIQSPSVDQDPVEKDSEVGATPALVVYGALYLLHMALMLFPERPEVDNHRIAFFRRITAERRATRLRETEERTLRGLWSRIQQTTKEDEKESFAQEAMPVARRLNQAVGWTALALPGEEEQPIPVIQVPDSPDDADTEDDGAEPISVDVSPEALASAHQEDDYPPGANGFGPNGNNGSEQSHAEEEDPYDAVLGRS